MGLPRPALGRKFLIMVSTANQHAKKRPNIVFITSDQQRGDCFGFEGRKVKTPHLDRLASEGTRFSTCITPNPVCQPARASLLTGLLPRTHGVSDNGIDLPEKRAERGFAQLMSDGGYESGIIGKMHFSTHHTYAPTGRIEDQSRIPSLPANWTGPHMGFGHVETMILGHYVRNRPLPPPMALHYERWYHSDGKGAEKTAAWETRLAPDIGDSHVWNSALPPVWHHSSWVGDRAVEFIRKKQDAPFVLWASFPDPHVPFDCPEPWNRMHAPKDVDLPLHRTRDLEQRPWWHRASLEGIPEMPDAELARHRAKYSRKAQQGDDVLATMIANYYGMISLIDHNVGRILATLEELDLADDTVVVYTSDHGDWLGDHGLILKGPMLYEGLLRVGCIVRGPNVPAGRVVDDPVSILDLPATFLDYGGISPPTEMHSQSLRGLIEDREGKSRDFARCEWDLRSSRCGVPLALRAVRTRTAKLTLEETSGEGEMYDLDADPHEMTNIFHDPSKAALKRELTDMIRSRPDDTVPMIPQVGMA